jgi:hypothetical protein
MKKHLQTDRTSSSLSNAQPRFAPNGLGQCASPAQKIADQKLVVVKRIPRSSLSRVSFDVYPATLLSISDWLPHELTAQDFFRCVAGRLGADQLSLLFARGE